MNLILSIILLLLLIIIGGKRGIKTYIMMYMNLFLVLGMVILVGWGFNPMIISFIATIVISLVVLFFLNGYNKKTLSAFISVAIMLLIFLLITIVIGNLIKIQGYSEETIEAIGYVDYNTGINMLKLSNAIILIGLIGNIIDTAIAIVSALYEVHFNNPELTIKELFASGMNIGKDILGTTTNTLFFAYLGGFMTFLIYFHDHNYSFLSIMNSKAFAAEFTRIILSGTASFIIIPLASIITAIICKKEDGFNEEIKYNLRRQGNLSDRQRTESSNHSNTKKRVKHSI